MKPSSEKQSKWKQEFLPKSKMEGKEEELLKKRFVELANRSYMENRFTFTNFLGLGELSLFYEVVKEIGNIPYTVFGGMEDSERAVIRFGSKENLGYLEEFPIQLLEISPLLEKFSDDLTHRDFLGALMNLGIEREVLGDILLAKNKAYMFCLDRVCEYIMDNLFKVKHTSVKVLKRDCIPEVDKPEPKEKLIQVSSVRIDGVIAHTYNLSRSEAVEPFSQKKVFRNGRLCENVSQIIAEGDTITVRGYGKFVLGKIGQTTRKGKINLTVFVY